MEAAGIRVGDLSETVFCELLASLSRARETGVLRLSGPAAEKSVYLQEGSVVFASSKDSADRLGDLLLQRGIVTREQLEQAVAKLSPGKRLGTALVELGFLPAADLPRWVREQVKEIIFSLFGWIEGEYRFEPGPFPSREAITLRLSTAEIFISGLRRVQKWSVLRRGAGEIRIPYRLSTNHADLLRDVTLGVEEKKILALLESRPLSMEKAAVESSLSTLTVYQLFFAFRVLGVIVASEEPVPVSKAQEIDAPLSDLVSTLRFVPPAPTPPEPVSAGEGKKEERPPGPKPRAVPKRVEEVEPAVARAAAPSPASGQKPAGQLESAPFGAQTVMLRMPIAESSPTQKEPVNQPPTPALETRLEIAPQVSDGGDPENQASTSPEPPPVPPAKPAPVATVPPVPVAERPAKRKESGSAQTAASGKEAATALAAAQRSRTEYKVVRMEAEKLDGNGTRQIEDLLRTWSTKGYRFAGVLPGKSSGLFTSTGAFFFIFSRDNPS